MSDSADIPRSPEPAPADAWVVRIPRRQIEARIAELGREIGQLYDGQEVTVVGVLNGALVFLADLLRRVELPVQVEVVALRSYRGESTSAGEIQWTHRLSVNLAGRHVLIVDDILDSGHTLQAVVEEVRSHGPASCRTCVLLRKRLARPVPARPLDADLVAFEIEDEFVVGYGLDFNGLYRNLPDVAALQINRPEK